MLYPEECFVSLFPILCLYFHPFFFYVLRALNKIDVPFRAEHAKVTYSKNFEQLQVSTLIKAPAHKRAFLITVGSSKDLQYKHKYQGANLTMQPFNKTIVGFPLRPIVSQPASFGQVYSNKHEFSPKNNASNLPKCVLLSHNIVHFAQISIIICKVQSV